MGCWWKKEKYYKKGVRNVRTEHISELYFMKNSTGHQILVKKVLCFWWNINGWRKSVFNQFYKPTSLIWHKLSAAGIHSATFLLKNIAQLNISPHSVQVSNPCFLIQQFQILHHDCCSSNLQPIHLLGAFDWYLVHKPQYIPHAPIRLFFVRVITIIPILTPS